MATSTIETKNTKFSIKELFLSQFMITVEQKLLDFCTNDIGLLLSGEWNCNNNLLNKAAVIGNPLRLVSLDNSINSDSINKLLNCTGSATVLEQNYMGKYLAIATGPNLSIFDLHKGSILRELHDHDGPINGIAWHRHSPWQLATVGADATLRLWDLRSHPAQIVLRRTSKTFSHLEYSPDCNYIGCAGQMVSIFDLNMAQSLLHMACPSPANNICFNPAECLLVTSSEDRVIRFWDVDSGECVTQSPAFDSSIGQICFTLDGQFLIVNTCKQISCIHWEPFELFSQLSYPIQMEIPAIANNSLDSPSFSYSAQQTPQINLLDLRIQEEILHQLVVVKTDPTKFGTICLASIPIQKLEKSGLNNSIAITFEEIIPTCPIANFKGEIELGEEEELEEEEAQQREEDDISPESIATSTTAESMIDNMTAIQSPHKFMQSQNHQLVVSTKKSPFTAPSNRKRPPVGSTIKHGISSVEISIDAIPASMPNSSGMKMGQKRQQRQSENNTTPEFKGLIRPNRLPIIKKLQHPSTSSSGQGSSDSSFSDNNRKTLIRRGNSLNDVNEIITTKNNNMPISSIAMANAKNRSRSHQAQHMGSSKFTMSNCSTSSNASSSSTTSAIGDSDSRRRTTSSPSDSMKENLEEFIHFDAKIRSSINKQKKEIDTLSANMGKISGNMTEHIVAETSHFEEPHAFAQLLKDYMRKPKAYSMGLNAAFLHRVHILIGRNNHYVQLSIDFLDMVTTRFGDCIKHGLASQEYTIGVDVAAEQRFERCMKSRNALFQIQLNESIYNKRMDSKQRAYFSNEILPRINKIIYSESQVSFNERANQSSFN